MQGLAERDTIYLKYKTDGTKNPFRRECAAFKEPDNRCYEQGLSPDNILFCQELTAIK